MFWQVASDCAAADKHQNWYAKPGMDYVVKGDILYIDLNNLFWKHQLWCRQFGKHTEFNTPKSLQQILETDCDYFLGREKLPDLSSVVNWMKFDMMVMADLGIDINKFSER